MLLQKAVVSKLAVFVYFGDDQRAITKLLLVDKARGR